MEKVRRQFETNVFELARMCQLVLPRDAAAGVRLDRQRLLHGREADVPRRRLLPRDQARRRGAERCPALRNTGLRRRGLRHRARTHQDQLRQRPPSARWTALTERTRTQASMKPSRGRRRRTTSGDPSPRLSSGPEAVAEAIETGDLGPQPQEPLRRYPSAHLFMGLRRLLPDRAWDALLRAGPCPQPGRKPRR